MKDQTPLTELATYLGALEDEMRRVLSSPDDRLVGLYNMMAYHMGWLDAEFRPAQTDPGKRIRPLLCLWCCEAAGGDWQRALPAAAAIEWVHNFSLIHDDIEDNSATRRGRATLWKVWGLAHGINTGDAMLIISRLALRRLSQRGVAPATLLAAHDILDRTCLQLCHGQYLDIAGEGQLQMSEESYREMIAGKTAALIAASAELGALIADAGEQIEHYRRFGWHLGMAFQMVDDLLGIWGDPTVTGKPAADDLRSRKMTLPVIIALRSSQALAELYRKTSLTEDEIAQALQMLEGANARQCLLEQAAHHEAQALAALQEAGARGRAAESLRHLALSLTGRQK